LESVHEADEHLGLPVRSTEVQEVEYV